MIMLKKRYSGLHSTSKPSNWTLSLSFRAEECIRTSLVDDQSRYGESDKFQKHQGTASNELEHSQDSSGEQLYLSTRGRRPDNRTWTGGRWAGNGTKPHTLSVKTKYWSVISSSLQVIRILVVKLKLPLKKRSFLPQTLFTWPLVSKILSCPYFFFVYQILSLDCWTTQSKTKCDTDLKSWTPTSSNTHLYLWRTCKSIKYNTNHIHRQHLN